MPIYDASKRVGAIEILEAWDFIRNWPDYSDQDLFSWVEEMGYDYEESTHSWVNAEQ